VHLTPILSYLKRCVENGDSAVKIKSFFLLNNIICNSINEAQAVVEADLIPNIMYCMTSSIKSLKSEATCCFLNIVNQLKNVSLFEQYDLECIIVENLRIY